MINTIATAIVVIVVVAFWLLMLAGLALIVCNVWLDLKDHVNQRRLRK